MTLHHIDPPQGVKCSKCPRCQFISSLSAIEIPGHMNCPGNDRHIIFIHTRGLTSVSIICIIIIKSLKFKMWRYGIGEAPPINRKHDNDAEKQEQDKQYEAKRERSIIQSWLAGRSWLRYDKDSKKMFCDYCIKNDVTTKYHVKRNSSNVPSCICYCYCQSMKLDNIKVINISGVARNCIGMRNPIQCIIS